MNSERNIGRKVFCCYVLRFLLSVSSVILCAVIMRPVTITAESDKNSTTGELYALSAVLMDADNGRILLEKNGDQILPMASTTKIMTCILALELADMEDFVSVSAYAAGMPKVHLGARKGDVFQLKDLMYSLMLESHNDSAVIIAEHIGNQLKNSGKRSVDNTVEESEESILYFTGMMNAKAEEIGCGNTFFVTPNGLDGTLTFTDQAGNTTVHQHSTTAADLARIMMYCISESSEKEAFLEITRTSGYSFHDYRLDDANNWKPGNRSFSCINHNAFLGMMEGALTGKTGFTGKAGYCYVGALERDEKTFTIALLACGWPNNKSWKWHDARILYGYGLNNYEKRDIYEPLKLNPIPVENGIDDSIPVKQVADEISLLLGAEDKVSVEVELQRSLTAPVLTGKTVGWQNYYVNGEIYAQIPVITASAVEKMTFRYCLEQILEKFRQKFCFYI